MVLDVHQDLFKQVFKLLGGNRVKVVTPTIAAPGVQVGGVVPNEVAHVTTLFGRRFNERVGNRAKYGNIVRRRGLLTEGCPTNRVAEHAGENTGKVSALLLFLGT